MNNNPAIMKSSLKSVSPYASSRTADENASYETISYLRKLPQLLKHIDGRFHYQIEQREEE